MVLWSKSEWFQTWLALARAGKTAEPITPFYYDFPPGPVPVNSRMKLIVAKANRPDPTGKVMTEDACKKLHGISGLMWNEKDKTLEIDGDVPSCHLDEAAFLLGRHSHGILGRRSR